MKTKLIIDGNNLAHRTFHTHKDDTFIPTFCRTIDGIIFDLGAEDCVVCWDRRLEPGSTNFRAMYKEYKQQRVLTEEKKLLYDLVNRSESAVKALGVKQMFPRKLEGDDVMSWCSHKWPGDLKVIISTDKDLLQLVGSEVHHYDSDPRRLRYTTLQNFEELHGVPHAWFVDYKCVLGDASDNVQGVHGIGEKRFFNYTDKNGLNIHKFTSEQQKIINRNRILMSLKASWQLEPGEQESYEKQWKKQEGTKMCGLADRDILLAHIK